VSGLYLAEINRAQRGCILFLLDQSYSMKDPFAGDAKTSKARAAADAINDLLMDLIIRCSLDFEGPRDYFDVGVIGYGAKAGVGPCLGGALKGRSLVTVGDLADNQLRVEERPKLVSDGSGGLATTTIKFPVWFDPLAEGGTPMREALEFTAKILRPWVASHQKSYPPIVINITDGEPTTGDPTKSARALTSLQTADGDVLLYNVHLSSLAAEPISFPAGPAKLPDQYAGLLFGMSSEVPPQIREELSVEGYPAEQRTRGFTFNANPWALLQFLDIGTRLALGA
jgi:hypothetical protein